MANQKYTNEFRKEAVKLALESDESNQKIADNLGIKYKTLMAWISQSMKDSDKSDKAVDYKVTAKQKAVYLAVMVNFNAD